MGSTSGIQNKPDSNPVLRIKGRGRLEQSRSAENSIFESGSDPAWGTLPVDDELPDEVIAASVDLSSDPDSAESSAILEEPTDTEALPLDSSEISADAEGTGVAAEDAESFIASKRIGDRIKHLRQRKQMGLVELGRYTGLSASFLSQLETGRVVPTLRNLARLAMVFSKDLSYFFEPERSELFKISRADERNRLPQTGVDEPDYFFESLGHVPMEHPVTPYFAEFLPLAGKRTARAHQHSGAEFLYMLTGELQITHSGASTTVTEGDAVYFNAASIHSYERQGETPCTALILTMPEPLRGTHTGAKIPLRCRPASRPRQLVAFVNLQTRRQMF